MFYFMHITANWSRPVPPSPSPWLGLHRGRERECSTSHQLGHFMPQHHKHIVEISECNLKVCAIIIVNAIQSHIKNHIWLILIVTVTVLWQIGEFCSNVFNSFWSVSPSADQHGIEICVYGINKV